MVFGGAENKCEASYKEQYCDIDNKNSLDSMSFTLYLPKLSETL